MSPKEEAAISYNPDDIPPLVPEDAFAAAERILMGQSGVNGVGKTRFRDGRDAIVAYVRDKTTVAQLPADISGIPVVGEVTGDICAQ